MAAHCQQGWVCAMAKIIFAGTMEKTGKNRGKNQQKLRCKYVILSISYYVSVSYFIGYSNGSDCNGTNFIQ